MRGGGMLCNFHILNNMQIVRPPHVRGFRARFKSVFSRFWAPFAGLGTTFFTFLYPMGGKGTTDHGPRTPVVAQRRWRLARHARAWMAPPIANSSRRDDGRRRQSDGPPDHGVTANEVESRTRIRRPSRTEKLSWDPTRHWRAWLISDVAARPWDVPTRKSVVSVCSPHCLSPCPGS